jgi:hypothetical protein
MSAVFAHSHALLDQAREARLLTAHHGPSSPHRGEVEAFIRTVFVTQYGADIPRFAPQLLSLATHTQITAAAGWRSAHDAPLYLESYLDTAIEHRIEKLAGHAVARRHIVEVGHLAATRPGGSVAIIRVMTRHFAQQGFDWVVFTATAELIRIFSRLGLPLIALGAADPARLGADAQRWGSYYATQPVVVAGRLRLAQDRIGLPS